MPLPPQEARNENPALFTSLLGRPGRQEVDRLEAPEGTNDGVAPMTTLTETQCRLVPANDGRALQAPAAAAARANLRTDLHADKAAVEAGSQPPHREPDEIHIHIGRIEVTAVPPAQARLVDRPARKTPSLEEYLRCRDGRES